MLEKTKVYLAGGFRSGWQDTVIDVLGTEYYEFFDPRKGKLKEPIMYTAIDNIKLNWCDFLFVNLEGTNPGGWDAIFEIGFAKALGKFVIFVDERSRDDPMFNRYCTMAKAAANLYSDDLEATLVFMTAKRGESSNGRD